MALVFDPAGVGFYDTGSGAVGLPRGTTAQRPVNPRQGFIRYNTDLQNIEIYGVGANSSANVANSWGTFVSGNYLASVLIVAGGGSSSGGGGGAGGLLYTTAMSLEGGRSYPVTVGGGGNSSNGGISQFNGVTAIGGGAAGTIGGSGGGNSWSGHNQWGPVVPGTFGQGNPGGVGYHNQDWGHSYGGGGGAGASGGWGTSGPGGAGGSGGSGAAYSIRDGATSVYYAGGGGSGQGARTHYGGGGAGGGGGTGSSGLDNSGGGGSNNLGGSGIVIISYAGYPRALGGATYFNQGSNPTNTFTTHTFLSSGTFIA
jgi:hypothetical protein